MASFLDRLQKELKTRGITVNESTVSLLLGIIVVLIVSVLAYNYFKNTRQSSVPAATTTNLTESIPAATPSGQISGGTAAVALPATHVVSTGESLWTIAEKYYQSGYNYLDIAEANKLTNPRSLEPGQTLTIPNVAVRQPLTVSGPQTTITGSHIEGGSYTVVKGDDLWNIALRAYGDGYRWIEIARANNLANPSLIFSGNILTLPRP